MTRSRLVRFALKAVGWVVPLAGLVLGASSSRADIYQYTDQDGVIHFSNREKKGKLYARNSETIAITAGRGGDSVGNVTRYDEYIHQAAALYQIPEELVRAVIRVESGFDPRAVSRTNARGLMQLMPETAERMLVSDVFDPRQNIFGGVRYLRILANLFNGDIELTLAGYNAGENAVIVHGGIPPFEETRQYVVKVLQFYRYYRDQKPS
ncbi:MAG TPA: lytic transglycosylase domain-containing protein [Polyangiaceae bacterium]|nr:lytic transglycosylase domain-containing protein [Polyangiaceae bacterium]